MTLDECPPTAHPACWDTPCFFCRILSSRSQPGCLIRRRITLYPPRSLVQIPPRQQSRQNVICHWSDHRRQEHKLQTLIPCRFSTLAGGFPAVSPTDSRTKSSQDYHYSRLQARKRPLPFCWFGKVCDRYLTLHSSLRTDVSFEIRTVTSMCLEVWDRQYSDQRFTLPDTWYEMNERVSITQRNRRHKPSHGCETKSNDRIGLIHFPAHASVN